MRRLAACFAFAAVPPLAAQVARTPPRLVVVVSVDQLRADYLDRFEPLFGDGGFRRIFSERARARRAHYGYAGTQTGPGHATLGSGVPPSRTGIVANTWLDRKTLAPVYCVSGPRGASPDRMRTENFADRWKAALGAESRVVSVSIKDRSAVLLGGRHADGVYWFQATSGSFVTSAWYRERRPLAASAERVRRIVDAFNATASQRKRHARIVDAWRGRKWERLLDPSAAEARVVHRRLPPDDRPGEMPPGGLGRVFPHPLPAKNGYTQLLPCTPFADELVLRLVDRLLRELALGRGERPDLLLIGLSALDYVGHAFGPNSHEVMDVVVRLDRALAALLRTLDTTAGKGRWTLALSADHGVAPIASWARERFGDGEYLDLMREGSAERPAGLLVRLSEHLGATFADRLPEGFRPLRIAGQGAARIVQSSFFVRSGYQLHFRPLLAEAGLTATELAAEAAAWCRLQGEVDLALTHQELRTPKRREDPKSALFAESFDEERSGDVMFALKPYLMPFLPRAGLAASHGSAHAYDRHVPILMLGKGIARGIASDGPHRVVDVVPTLARITGVPVPEPSTGQPIAGFLHR